MVPVLSQQVARLADVLVTATSLPQCRSSPLHITLYGPATLKWPSRPGDLTRAIARACLGVGKFTFFPGAPGVLTGTRGRAVVLHADPDTQFLGVYQRLVGGVHAVARSTSRFDSRRSPRIFHVSLLARIRGTAWHEVFRAFPGNSPGDLTYPGTFVPRAPIVVLKVILIGRGRKFLEFDLPRGRWLSLLESLDPASHAATLRAYRENEAYELTVSYVHPPGEVFVIGDLCLGHEKNMQNNARPFTDVAEMDEVLIRNWNITVTQADQVISIGNLAPGRDATTSVHYQSRLNGRITLVQGTHDCAFQIGVPFILDSGGISFLFVHDPADAPPGFDGWIVHSYYGDQPLAFPFLNFSTRMCNVSAELVRYHPVSLNEISSYILTLQEGEVMIERPPRVSLTSPRSA
ncbi:MAG: hypothetical protein NT074_00590 [Methanomicrobiales archaeon]|nr:hypothetical protein [Methanomicrobiales archaeon]